jgi:RNA polymerase sigma-70 factor (ECF subfamily)
MPEDVKEGSSAVSVEAKGGFMPTQWSLVLSAGRAGSMDALEQLCRAYWPPVYSHLRRQGIDRHQAEDLTQEFFARLLDGDSFAGLSPEKGRFRSFLLVALKHFQINEGKRERALKRGGGRVPLALDGLEPSMREAYEPRDDEPPDVAYDRRWALTVLERVRGRLTREFEAVGQGDRHAALEVYLTEGGAPAYQQTAERLGISEAAVKSAIYKLRQRFGQLLRLEISGTVADPSEVEDEVKCLIEALRG